MKILYLILNIISVVIVVLLAFITNDLRVLSVLPVIVFLGLIAVDLYEIREEL